ncbi:MAG: hypothetical protein IT455_00685 [Planctomycetes bacterium]|nr:hypothetical protein [Planctomycetota bacterium]
MRSFVMRGCALFLILAPLWAQTGGEPVRAGGEPVAEAKNPKAAKVARPVVSDAGKAALAQLRSLTRGLRGLDGDERKQALEAAATAHDQVVADFAAEKAVAGNAAFAAAELWRQQGSLALAEKDYLQAAQIDAERYAQRALMGAADMQRRQNRDDEAFATYAKAEAVEPGSARAQTARLWQARLLQAQQRLEEAIPRFQAALESAAPGQQTIDAANYLALAWIQHGDLDAAGRAIEHAEDSLQPLADEDPIVLERLRRSIETMSAKKALQRARDKKSNAAKDAVGLDEARRVGQD